MSRVFVSCVRRGFVPGCRVVLPLALIVLCQSASLLAQTPSAILSGVVTDESGAVVAHAALTLADASRGVQRRTVSNGQGAYVFAGVPPGTYVLLAVGDGFASVQVEGIALANGDHRALPVTLKVASVAENVSVTAAGKYATTGRVATSLREIPQSVSVVSRQQMDDWNAVTIAEALTHVVGVTIEPFGNGVADISTRGFGVSSIQVDGLSTEAGIGSYTTSALDMAAYDRIEVQRGSAGLFQGSGEPGGTVNLVRKRALSRFATNGSIMAGSWETYRAEVDVTGPLTRNGSLRGRVVGVYDDRGSFMDHVFARKPMFYGTLEYSPTARTTASVGMSYQSGTSRPVFGLPTYADGRLLDASRSTYLGSLWDRQTEDTDRYFVDVEHKLSNGGEIRLRLDQLDRVNELKYSSFGTSALAAGTSVVGVNQISRNHRRLDRGAELYASVPVRLLSSSDNVLVGMTYREFTQESRLGRGPTTTRDVLAPDPLTPEPTFTFADPVRSTISQRGVFGQVRLRLLPGLTAIGGGRLSQYEAALVRVSGKFVPYAGLVYDVTTGHSAYVSYSSIFQPQNSVDRFGAILPPRSGDQIEAGVNGELRSGTLTTHAAVFQIADRNRAISDPEDPDFSIASGEVQSRGFEAEITGRPSAGWNLTAGYAFTNTVYERGTPAQEGRIFAPGTPRHALTAWARHDFGQGQRRGLFVGGGVTVSSGVFAQSGTVRFEQDAYAVPSVHAGYRVSPRLTLQVAAENLSDTTYYARVSGGGRQSYFGAPRSVVLTIRVQP